MISNCTRCQKAIRIHPLVNVADAPGTIRGYKTGLCVNCTRVNLRNGIRQIAPAGSHLNCKECGRRTRPPKTRRKDYPGTMARGSASLCLTCYGRFRKGLPELETTARMLKVPELSEEEKQAAARVVARYGGDAVVLTALGLSEVCP